MNNSQLRFHFIRRVCVVKQWTRPVGL